MDFLPTSGRSAARAAAFVAPLLLLAGCLYGFRGGGGFPDHIRTIFIAPFENRTSQFDVEAELARRLTENLPRALGVRLAGEGAADAVVRGRITGYSDVAQSYAPGQPGSVDVFQHQVQITIVVEVVDVRNNEILWDSQGLTGRGEYRPDSQNDQVARLKAIESLIQQIVDGAQSQW
jgi:curli biogenesis system outer membrane secretion channel CsgG